jgi:hypothetical protein
MRLDESLAHDPKIMARFTRCITAHAPIGEYRRDFAPLLDFACPCGMSLYESREHVLQRCPRFSRKHPDFHSYVDSLTDFLKDNPNSFEFLDRALGNYDDRPPSPHFPEGPPTPGNGTDNQAGRQTPGRQSNAQQCDPHLHHRPAHCHQRHANGSIPPPLCCEQEAQERPSQSPVGAIPQAPQEGTGLVPTNSDVRGQTVGNQSGRKTPGRQLVTRGAGKGKDESQHLTNALAAEICHANITFITARVQGAMDLGARAMPLRGCGHGTCNPVTGCPRCRPPSSPPPPPRLRGRGPNEDDEEPAHDLEPKTNAEQAKVRILGLWRQGETKVKAPWAVSILDSAVGEERIVRWIRRDIPHLRSFFPTDGRDFHIRIIPGRPAEYWEETRWPKGLEHWDHTIEEWWDLEASDELPFINSRQALAHTENIRRERADLISRLRTRMNQGGTWFGGVRPTATAPR